MNPGWAEKQRLGNLPTYARAEGSDIQQFASLDEEARMLVEGGETVKVRPAESSRWFAQTAADINAQVAEAGRRVGSRNKEFDSTVADLKILGNLALFHSRRIPAAVSHRLFERTGDPGALDDAIAHELSDFAAWRQLVDAAGDFCADDLIMGVRGADLRGWAAAAGLPPSSPSASLSSCPASIGTAPGGNSGSSPPTSSRVGCVARTIVLPL